MDHFDTLNISESDKEKILGENACELFKINSHWIEERVIPLFKLALTGSYANFGPS